MSPLIRARGRDAAAAAALARPSVRSSSSSLIPKKKPLGALKKRDMDWDAYQTTGASDHQERWSVEGGGEREKFIFQQNKI